MKKNSYLLLVLFFAVTTVLSSCKKDDESPARLKTELLADTTSKTWKITNEETVMMGYKVSTFSFFRDQCSKDDVTIFFTNKNFEEREGASKCSSEDLLDDGTWSLSSDEKKITIDYGSYNEIFDIVELSASSLKLEIADPDSEDVKIVYTYTAQ